MQATHVLLCVLGFFGSHVQAASYPDRVELLGGVAQFSDGIVTAADSPINNIKHLVNQSKTSKGVFFGVTGASNNFPFLKPQKLTGGKSDQVTCTSSTESISASMGKHVDVALQGPSEYAELMRAGQLT
jgi:tripartite-type tricarboxylate transporter receptor subunit TctC